MKVVDFVLQYYVVECILGLIAQSAKILPVAEDAVWSVCLCVLCVCMLDATAVQKWLNWSTCGLVVGARNNVSDGVPGSPLGKGQFWGLSPPLKCIWLCKQHMPAAARVCRLVCRGSTLWRKHCFSEWTRLPRGWRVGAMRPFVEILWSLVGVVMELLSDVDIVACARIATICEKQNNWWCAWCAH